MQIKTKRIYDKAESSDGRRILVDRIWPRGVAKTNAEIDEWYKDIAPSDELRKWFGHDRSRWVEFKARYFAELDGKTEQARALCELASHKAVTLVYAAKDEMCNNAAALKEYLETVACPLVLQP